MTKRPWFKSSSTKVTYDVGTPNEQTVTYPPVTTRLNIAVANTAWALSQLCMVEEECFHRSPCKHRRQPPKRNRRYSGSGFYMSQPGAARLRWIWRGRSIYSLFWGQRTKNGLSFELRDDRIGTQW